MALQKLQHLSLNEIFNGASKASFSKPALFSLVREESGAHSIIFDSPEGQVKAKLIVKEGELFLAFPEGSPQERVVSCLQDEYSLYKENKGKRSSSNQVFIEALIRLISRRTLFFTKVFLATKNKILVEEERKEISQLSFLQKHPSFFYKERPKDYQDSLHLTEAFFVELEGESREIISLKDLAFSPLGALLPSDFLGKKIRNLHWDMQFLREEAYFSDYEKKVANAFLFYIQDLVTKGRVRCFLIEKPYVDIGIQADFNNFFRISPEIKRIYIEDVLFKNPSIKIVDRKLKFSVDYEIDLKNSRMLGSLFHFKESQSLYISTEDVIRQNIKSLFAADSIRFDFKSLSFSLEESPIKRSVSYQKSFYDTPLELLQKFKNLFPVELDQQFSFKEESFEKFDLYFSNLNQNKILVSSSLESAKVETEVMENLARFLYAFKGGLAQFREQEAVQVAVNGSKRMNELKLLKSSGFFTYLTLKALNGVECLSWDKKALSYVGRYTENTVHDITEVISDNLISFIDDSYLLVKDLLSKSLFYVNSDSFLKFNFATAQEDFLKALIDNFQKFYGRQIIFKDDFFDFEIQLKHNKEKGLEVELNFPFNVEISSFIEKANCVFDDEKLYVLPESAFKAKIEVLDKSIEGGQKDWFELDPRYYFEGKEISEEEAKNFQVNSIINHKGKLYFISPQNQPDLKLLNYLWKNQSLISSPKENKRKDDVKFYRSYILDILALKHSGLPVHGGAKWQKIVKEYEELEKKTNLEMKSFNGSLKAFQEKGVFWLNQLYNLGLGGVLADDMGLGKTVQILAFLNHLENLKANRKHLVVVPTSLVHNWKNEIQKFTPEFNILIYKTGMEGELRAFKKGIVVITYGLLSERREFLSEMNFDVVVLDEAQQIKNINSKRSQASRNLKSEVKICLTGTPMENHYGEFYSLIDTSVPGALGKYEDFIKSYGPKKLSSGQVGSEQIEFLKKKTKPLVLRRTKDEVLDDLPEKTESLIKIEFDDQQKEIYKNIALLWNSKVKAAVKDQGESKTQLQMFAALMKLRQICSCPEVVVGNKYSKLSPKIELVVDQIEELIQAEKSVIVFTNFVSTLETIKAQSQKRGVPTLSITGKDSQSKRENTLDHFNEEGPKVLIMTLKTGGVGLNLTKANYIIHVEPWWNPAAENQGTDRAHRIGQKQRVHVYRYIMSNSIEEKIQNLKDLKQEAFNTLLTDSEGEEIKSSFSSSGLSQKDFEYLLS